MFMQVMQVLEKMYERLPKFLSLPSGNVADII